MAETFLYITIGTNDVARAARFYDAALAPLGLIPHSPSKSLISLS